MILGRSLHLSVPSFFVYEKGIVIFTSLDYGGELMKHMPGTFRCSKNVSASTFSCSLPSSDFLFPYLFWWFLAGGNHGVYRKIVERFLSGTLQVRSLIYLCHSTYIYKYLSCNEHCAWNKDKGMRDIQKMEMECQGIEKGETNISSALCARRGGGHTG